MPLCSVFAGLPVFRLKLKDIDKRTDTHTRTQMHTRCVAKSNIYKIHRKKKKGMKHCLKYKLTAVSRHNVPCTICGAADI